MSEVLSNTLYGISFFLSLFVSVGLWWATAKFSDTRRLWEPLALGCTLGLIADFAWGILYLVDSDVWLDWIDYLYVARYLFFFLAFWLYPKSWLWRQWLAMLAAILWGWILLWLLIILPTDHPDPAYAWGGMIFPVLDVGILYAAVFRWKTSQESLSPVFFWLSLAMLVYGTANWFNYSVRVINPEADSLAALVFWLLSTVFTGVALWRFRKHDAAVG
jgi:hypothetical protein